MYICSVNTQEDHQQDLLQGLNKAEKVIVAVSGGVDSMVLLDVLRNEGFPIVVAHCNFGLRKDAEKEKELVQNYCAKYDIPFYVSYFDTKTEAEREKESIQMAARRLRYQWFETLRQELGFSTIATAHHADDHLETILLNLSKGTGIRGLAGIPHRKANLVRPLLYVTKEKIKQYAKENQVPFVEDASNTSNVYQRNKIRNKILPLIKEINPNLSETTTNNIDVLAFNLWAFESQMNSLEKKLITTNNDQEIIFINQWKKMPFAKQILFEILSKRDFSKQQIDAIYELMIREPSKASKIYKNQHYQAVIDNKNRLILEKCPTNSDSTISIEKNQSPIESSLGLITVKTIENGFIPMMARTNEVYLDASKIEYPLQIRKWKDGDYFYPFGLGKKQKIAKFLTNAKVNKLEKEKTYVLTSGDYILWVIGYRSDDRFKITPSTKNMLYLNIQGDGFSRL